MALLSLVFLSSISFAAQPPSAAPQFDIDSFQVSGNTLLEQAAVDRILKAFTGRMKTFSAVEDAREALEKAYRDKGYFTVLVVVPEQEVAGGRVRLNVLENRIENIKIKKDPNFDEENIRRSLPGLREGIIPDINAVSRSLNLANESPAKKTQLNLVDSGREKAVDAEINITSEKPWKVGLYADNTGDSDTGRARLGVLAQHANLFNRDHLLTLQYITSEKFDKVNIYSAGYRVPFYSLGSSLDVIGAYSNVDAGTVNVASTSMDVSGKGTVLGVHYNQNLTRMGNYTHKAALGFDYRAYDNDVNFLGAQLGSKVTVHPLSATYSGNYAVERFKALFYVMGLQNLPYTWDGRDTEDNFNQARSGASRDYNLVRYGAEASGTLSGDWQLRALVNGQYTDDQLVPGEQFGLGGARSVRGFIERATSGDQGYSATVEAYTPDLAGFAKVNAFQARLLAFYDWGEAADQEPLPGEAHSARIASFGPGLRITDGKRFAIAADLGIVCTPPGENTLKSNDNVSRWSRRWHLSASVVF
jgi:hemolysin activation/secretion protein